jgi:hypothetical protein
MDNKVRENTTKKELKDEKIVDGAAKPELDLAKVNILQKKSRKIG